MAAPEPGTAGPGDRPSGDRPEPLLRALQSIWRELPGLLSDRVELLSLELQRAGRALVQICMFVVAAAILGVTAWLVLWAGIVATLIAFGMPLPWALLIVLAVNLLVAWFAVARVRALLPQLSLPATRRHLTLTPAPHRAPPPAEPPPQPRPGHDPNDFPPASQAAAR